MQLRLNSRYTIKQTYFYEICGTDFCRFLIYDSVERKFKVFQTIASYFREDQKKFIIEIIKTQDPLPLYDAKNLFPDYALTNENYWTSKLPLYLRIAQRLLAWRRRLCNSDC